MHFKLCAANIAVCKGRPREAHSNLAEVLHQQIPVLDRLCMLAMYAYVGYDIDCCRTLH